MDTWDMPDWRRDDGTMMIWDPTSHTYVEGPTDGGDLAVDRGHASGGDNDLFDPAQGGDGEGHGNLFQPSNPDNNGWLDGKIAMAMGSGHWQQILETHPYFYHVTEANRIPSIQQHGLTPGSAVSEKTEGVWTEMGGIPARQGFLYLWASLEGAEHGAEWFLGIQNPATITIDATKLDPNLIEADEDYASSDPENFMEQHGGPTPDEYYGNTDEYDQGNWSGYTPDQIAAEAGSNWSVENPMLKDPGATWESYKGFGDRQDFHGRVAYGGPIPLEAILKIDAPRTAKTAETAIAPTMPDINYVLDYNPEDLQETGWSARYNNDKLGDWHRCDECFRTGMRWNDARDFLLEMAPEEPEMNALENAQPDQPFYYEYRDAYLGRCTYELNKDGKVSKTAEVAEAPTIAPAMPDLNYVLDYNPEDTNETGWFARIWSPNYEKGADQPIGGKSNKTHRDLHPTGVWNESFGTWQQCYDYLREAWKNEDFYKHLDVAQPNEPFEWQWDGSNTNGANMSAIGFMFPVIAEITPVDSKTSKVAMPYHVSPRGNRQEIEQEGLLDTTGSGGIYHWDTPEQASAYWDWLNGDLLGTRAGDHDVWEFPLTDEQQDRTESDERLHHDMWNYFRPDKDADGEQAFKEFHNEPWDSGDPETEEFGAWFTPGLNSVPPDKLKRVAMPYHVSPQKNREKIEQEGLHTLDVNHAGTPQDGDGLYYWDTPEQAKFFGDTEYAPKPYDMWQFDLDHQFEQPETDEFFGDMTPEEANQYYGDGMDLFYNEDGTPGAHYIPGGHVSPDRIKRVGMAQQTGDPELDSLIAEFSQKYDKMRDPVNSEMSCQWMSWEFVNFLRERGIPASTGMSMDTNRTEPEPDDWHDDEFASLPEIGYDDAPIDNGMTHCVVYVPRDEATYMVDWTASQYGYSEFPMVQRMQGDPASGISFERNF